MLRLFYLLCDFVLSLSLLQLVDLDNLVTSRPIAITAKTFPAKNNWGGAAELCHVICKASQSPGIRCARSMFYGMLGCVQGKRGMVWASESARSDGIV